MLGLVAKIGFTDQFGGRDDLADFAILGFELVAVGQFLVLGQGTGQVGGGGGVFCWRIFALALSFSLATSLALSVASL